MPPCVRTVVLHPQSRIRKTNETKKAVTEQVSNSVTAVSALILLFEENGKRQWQGGGKALRRTSAPVDYAGGRVSRAAGE